MSQMPAKRPVIAILIPCVDKPHMQFASSISRLTYDCGAHDIPIALIYQSGSAIHKTRNLALNYAFQEIEAKGTPIEWTLWLDSDMVFPHYLLRALLQTKKSIVGCTYVRRSPPYSPLGKTLDDLPRELNEAETLIKMSALPTGILLVRRSVYSTLKKPYFRFNSIEESLIGANDDVEWGEDYDFCTRARAAGHEIWLDVALSKTIGHVAEKPLYIDQPVFAHG